MKANLNASEKALQAYRDREGMLDNKSTVLGGTARQLDALTQKQVDARVRLSEAEEATTKSRPARQPTMTVPAVVKSPSVQRAKEVEAEAEKKLAEFRSAMDPSTEVCCGQQRPDRGASNTRRQIQNLVASVVKDTRPLGPRQDHQDALSQSKATIQSLNRKEIQLGMLEQDAATNRQLYQAFLSRFKETSATRNAQG